MVLGAVAREPGHQVSQAPRAVGQRIALLALVAAFAFAGCSSAAPPTPQIVYVTPEPTVAASPAATPTLKPTPTPTPRPTAAPTPNGAEPYAAFLLTSGIFASTVGDDYTGIFDAMEAGDFDTARGFALDLGTEANTLGEWLTANEPHPCYQEVWALLQDAAGHVGLFAAYTLGYIDSGNTDALPKAKTEMDASNAAMKTFLTLSPSVDCGKIDG